MDKENRKECARCGSKNFYVNESVGYSCKVDTSGELVAYKVSDSEIHDISCMNCGKSHDTLYFEDVILEL